ncbi:MAG: tetratricopeptide repeat protein [Alphaproteobacteria bacterium]|nr:MAG: tetratricopeptide repeat protein [Alphaproteobacteria bacterium]
MSKDKDQSYNELEQAIADEARMAKWRKLWNQFGLYLIIVVAVVLAGAAFVSWRSSAAQKDAVTYSNLYEEARMSLMQGEVGFAVQKLNTIVEKGPINYKTMSQFLLIEYYRSMNNVTKILETYQAIINNRKTDSFYRELAQLNLIRFKIDQGNTSNKDLEGFAGELAKLKNEHVKKMAMEIEGYIYYLQGDHEKARSTYIGLAQTPGIDHGMRERAQAMVRLIHMERQKDAKK